MADNKLELVVAVEVDKADQSPKKSGRVPPCQDTTRPARFLTVSAGEIIMTDSGYLERKECAPLQ